MTFAGLLTRCSMCLHVSELDKEETWGVVVVTADSITYMDNNEDSSSACV